MWHKRYRFKFLLTNCFILYLVGNLTKKVISNILCVIYTISQLSTPGNDHAFWVIAWGLVNFITLGIIRVLVFGSVLGGRLREGFRPKRLWRRKLEWWWRFIPILIVVLLDIPNLIINYAREKNPFPVLGAKIVGLQWYWQYELEFLSTFTRSIGAFFWLLVRGFVLSKPNYFVSILADCKGSIDKWDFYNLKHLRYNVDSYEAKWGLNWLSRLSHSDARLVLPLNTPCRLVFRGSDVIHNFNIKSLGISVDCVPGRLSQHKFLARKVGVFHGLCRELCGVNHPHIPCRLEVIPHKVFLRFLHKDN